MKRHILIAEDEAPIRLGLIDLLEADGYRVTAAADGSAALDAFGKGEIDLVLLDVMMPEKSGYDVCREIRRQDATTPIIMLTAKGEEIDKVLGLELGADDYVTKPFGLHELRARISAVLRRSKPEKKPEESSLSDCFSMGNAKIDRKAYKVTLGSRVSSLTARELKLLEIFYQQAGEVLSRNDLLNRAWGRDYFGTTRTLDQHIAQLRKKVEADPANPEVILTVHGIGYRFMPG